MDTYIVRVWRSELTHPEAEPLALRGVVTHVASNHEQVFRSPGELLAFLDAATVEPADRHQPPTLGRRHEPEG